jgi:AcrR family transcriptional regulator
MVASRKNERTHFLSAQRWKSIPSVPYDHPGVSLLVEVDPVAAHAPTRTARRKHPAPTQNGEGRRERNKREKRDRIVASARDLFQKQGYANTTAQQIAKGARIASGTLFLYAKSKEDLLILVFTNEMMDLIEKAYGEIDTDAPLLEQTTALFKRFIAYHARDVDIARELIREITFLSNRDRAADLRAITQAIIKKLVTFADQAAERREIDPNVDRSVLANCLFSIYYQQLQTWLSGYVSKRRFEQNLAAMLAFAIDGARPKSARRR